jgi:hypothetical protein
MIVRRRLVAAAFAIAVLGSAPALAQSGTTGAATSNEGGGAWSFIGGAGASFAAHELGHVLFDVAFDANPHIKKISFQGIPFFAIVHTTELSPRQEYTVSASGLWIQNGWDEWILSRNPSIRQEHAPFNKGVLAMGVLTSVVYGGAGLFRIGPPERDTRSMAAALNVDERWVGLMVLVPALLDVYRYFHPGASWATWSSRGVKAGMVLLVIK